MLLQMLMNYDIAPGSSLRLKSKRNLVRNSSEESFPQPELKLSSHARMPCSISKLPQRDESDSQLLNICKLTDERTVLLSEG